MHPILLTFDLEYWFESLSVQKYLVGKEDDSLANFIDKLLFLLAETNSLATFFITGKVLDKEPELVKKINDAGHEIAVHSLNHKPLWKKNPKKFRIEIKHLSNKIKEISGQNPIGHRAVNFSLNNKTKWALKILSDNNFKYDSSILRYGLKPNFYKVASQQNGLIEIPVFSGGIYIRLIPWFIFKELLKNKLEKQPTCLYLHPFDFLAKVPDINMPKFKKLLKYYNTKNTWHKFEYIINKFNCVSIKDYLKYD